MRSPLESVDRALRLLDLLADGDVWSVAQVADHLDVATSTAHRLLTALRARRFAERQDDGGYRAGPALRGAVEDPGMHERLRRVARPALELLHREVDETAQLMVRRGTDIRFLDGIESDRPLRVVARLGDHLPAHCSAGGKALLAELDGAELRALYAGGLPRWPTASVSSLDALLRQLRTVRRRGHGTNRNETEPGVSGVGVVVRDAQRAAVGALTLAIPTDRFSRSDETAYAVVLGRAAEGIRTSLGG